MQLQFWRREELIFYAVRVLAPWRDSLFKQFLFGAGRFFFQDLQYLECAVVSCLRLIVLIRDTMCISMEIHMCMYS